MQTLLQAAVVLGCIVAGFRLRPAGALALLTGVVVLLPAAVQLPNGVTALPTATRLTALAIAVGLARRRELWRTTPMVVPAVCFAFVTLLTGVLLAQPELGTSGPMRSWLDLLDPLLVGAVALACARAAGPRATVAALGGVALLAVGAGVSEHLTGSSLARHLVPAKHLETRAGETRIRVGSDFALAFAWTVAALTPAVVALLRRRLPLALLGLAGCVLAAYWTFSRSVPLGIALGLVLLAVGLRDRRTAALVLVCAVGLGSVALVPTVRYRFSRSADQGAVDVRFQRAPVVLDAASRDPVTGLGLTGVAHLAIGETDESFLLAYAETGVLGSIALLGLLLCGLVLVGRGLRGPPSPGRTATTVALAGAVVLVVGATVFDAFSVRGTAALLGLLIGVGIAAAESVAGPAPTVPWNDLPRTRLAAVPLAVLVGIVTASLAPTHVAVTARFTTFSQAELAVPYDPIDEGRQRVATVCAVVTAAQTPHVRVDCADTFTAAGEGTIRVEVPRAKDLPAAFFGLFATVRRQSTLSSVKPILQLPVRSGASTALATAPWSLGLAALLVVLLVPSEPVRRLHARTGRWTWSVDRGDGVPGPPGPFRPAGRVRQQPVERLAESR